MNNSCVEFKGECLGVKLVKRGANDGHITVQIMVEDDDNWFDMGQPFSSAWIDELIEKLQEAKKYMESQESDPGGYGWRFKKKNAKPKKGR